MTARSAIYKALKFLKLKTGLITSIISAIFLTACTHHAPQETHLNRAQQIHQQILVLDAHADVALPSTNPLYLGENGSSKVSPEKLKTGGVGAVVMSIAVGPGPDTDEARKAARALADEKLNAVQALIAAHKDSLVLATSAQDVLAAREAGNTAILLGFQNARSLEGNVDVIDDFYAQGVRIFGLSHLGHNQFSNSSRPQYDGATKSYEPDRHGGLSARGIAAIKKINALGGLVDVSQMSKAATLQTIVLSKTPVIASHSNVKTITDVTRNLSDAEIDQIGDTGGVIHIAPFGAYLVDLTSKDTRDALIAVRVKHGLPEAHAYPYELYWELPSPAAQRAFIVEARTVIGAGSLEDMMRHIDYIVDRIGIDHVGIGSDFNHGSGIEGFRDASDAMNVTQALIERGYSQDDIEKIWGLNFLRVLQDANLNQDPDEKR